MNHKIFYIFLIFPLLIHVSNAHTLVMKADEEVVQYNKYYESFIPQELGKIDPHKPMGVFFNPSKYPDFLVSFYSTPNTSIFINNILVYQHPLNKIPGRVALDLKNIIPNNEYKRNKPVLLLFYNIDKHYLFDSLYYASNEKTNFDIKSSDKIDYPQRTVFFNKSAWVGMVLLLLVVAYIYKWYIINTSKVFETNNFNSKSLYLEPIPFMKSLFLMLLISIIWSLIFYWPFIYLENSSLQYPVFSYIKMHPNLYYIALLIFLFIFLKLNFYKLVDYFNGVSNFHISSDKIWLYTMFRISVFIFITELLISFVIPTSWQISIYEYMPIACILTLIWLSMLSVFYNFNHSSAKNIYLFSYICTAEILPLVISYRLLIGGV